MPQHKNLNGFSLVLILGGTVLAYSGLNGKTITKNLGNLLSGSSPDPVGTGVTISGVSDGTGITTGANSASAVANQSIARVLTAPYGWSTGQEWNDLVSLWTRESGWSNTADTRKSGLDPANASVFAYGIAQARPATKYPLPGRPSDLGGVSDPTSQIAWGLSYISGRYGTPSQAWAHELANGWY